MKKKYLLLFLCLMLLAGCRVNKKNVASLTEETLNSAVSSSLPTIVTNNKGLISYYLPASIGRISSDPINSVLKIYGNDVVVMIDVSSIISHKYYNTTNTSDELRELDAFPNQVYEKTGSFTTASDLVRAYRYRLYHIEGNKYGILIQTSNLIGVTIVPIGDVLNVSSELMQIFRCSKIDEEAVVIAYSQKELINYQKETLDIFDKVYPESGTLKEMLEDD